MSAADPPAPPGVTLRYAPQAVTERYPAADVTQRYPAEAETTATPRRPGLPLDSLIAGRYQIVQGPLGEASGEAEVYRCRDRQDEAEVAVKLYRYYASPKQDVLEQLRGLAHPNLMALFSYGEWEGRLYEVLEYCAGGVLADCMPLSLEAVRAALPGLAHGLDYCHRQGIIHRDIKPNNLFFRQPGQRQPLLGDFGISSYFDPASRVRVTQSAAHLTLDYAAPELLDGHQVSPKTDFYSLGVTLAHLISGVSPFQGMSANDILVAHLRGRLKLPDGLPLEWQNLLRGLTLPDPAHRWGYPELMAWLRGEAVALVLDSLQHADPGKSAVRPYPGYPQATTPQQLARDLERFDAITQLFRGDIRRWAFDYVSQELAEAIQRLELEERQRPQLALVKLRYLLDPQAPLRLGQGTVRDLEQLAERLLEAQQNPALYADLERALWEETLEAWLGAGQHAGARTAELLEKLSALRRRLQHKARDAALFGLLYLLNPGHPLRLEPGLQVTGPRQFEPLLKQDRLRLERCLNHLIFSRRLEEWLRAVEYPDWQTELDFLEGVRMLYLEQRRLGIYCVLWHYVPKLPLPFAGQYFTDPVRLAACIDQSEELRQRGLQLVQQGWLRAWLVGAGLLETPLRLDHALLAVDATWESKLEAVLHLLDPALPTPQLQLSPRQLDFASVGYGEHKVRRLSVTNPGRGYLSGEITLAHYGAGVGLSEYVIEGNQTELEVSLEPLGQMLPGEHRNALIFHTNGGDQELPLRFRLYAEADPEPPWWHKLLNWF